MLFYNRDLITPWILCGLFYFIKSLSNRCHVGNGIHLSLWEQKVLLNQYCKLQTPTFNNIKVRKFVCSLACGNANTTQQYSTMDTRKNTSKDCNNSSSFHGNIQNHFIKSNEIPPSDLVDHLNSIHTAI